MLFVYDCVYMYAPPPPPAPNFQFLNKQVDFRETWYGNCTISLHCLALEFLNSVIIKWRTLRLVRRERH